MQIAAPPVAPSRGGYLNSPAITVQISDEGDWAINGAQWQDPTCGCAADFPICLPHTKSPSNSPGRSESLPAGMESSYACTPPFSQETLFQMASQVVEASTEDRVAFNIAAQLAALPPITIIPGPYGLLQGIAVLLTAVYAAGRGVIHANPYLIALLLEQNLLLVDASGNVSTVLGGHYVIANPYLPIDRLVFTGYGKILLSTILRTSTFDHLTNEQREGAERHLLAAFNDCGARQVIVSV